MCDGGRENALPHILPVIARGLQQRLAQQGESPLDLIIAENVRNAADYFRAELKQLLPAEYAFDRLVGLVETSIGKMVPIMKQEDIEKDPLWVFAEPYNTLIVDKRGFKNPVPAVEGVKAVENIAPMLTASSLSIIWAMRRPPISGINPIRSLRLSMKPWPSLNCCKKLDTVWSRPLLP